MTDDMKQEIDGLRSEMRELVGAVRGMDGKLDALGGELGAVKGELGAVKGELGRLDAIERVLRRVAATTANTKVDLTDYMNFARSNFVTRGEFHDRMDGFSGRIEDFRLHMAHQQERLDDHLKPEEAQ